MLTPSTLKPNPPPTLLTLLLDHALSATHVATSSATILPHASTQNFYNNTLLVIIARSESDYVCFMKSVGDGSRSPNITEHPCFYVDLMTKIKTAESELHLYPYSHDLTYRRLMMPPMQVSPMNLSDPDQQKTPSSTLLIVPQEPKLAGKTPEL